MKFLLVIVIALVMLGSACRLETSSATPDSNVKASPTVELSGAPIQETSSTCSLKMAGAPAIIGLRLGMTTDEVLALFPGSTTDPEVQNLLSPSLSQFGASRIMIRPAKYEVKDQYAGINQIIIAFLDDHVSSLNIGYNGPAYSHVDKFVEKFVEGTNLPSVDQWEAYVGLDNSLKILKCAEFEVRVFAGGQGGNLNYILLKDLVAEKKLKDRRAKAAAQVTPTPKQ